MKWLDAVKMIAPIAISIAFPPAIPAIPFIVHGIDVAESMPGTTGQQKLATALDITNTGMQGINAARPGTIDTNAVNAVANQAISLGVQIANLFSKDSAKLSPPPPAN